MIQAWCRLPESADTANINADLKDGVLHVTIPKKEKAAKQRRITVGKGEQKKGEEKK